MSVNQLVTSTVMTTPDKDRDGYAIQKARFAPRRVFIFCDGTWQDGVNSGNVPTNIATLARCIKPIADDGYIQISYYDSGVGNVTSKPAQLIDGATGRGMSLSCSNRCLICSLLTGQRCLVSHRHLEQNQKRI